MSIKLTDIIDVRTLQEIQDGFSAATGMAALITDADGKPITKGSGFTDFCMNLTRKSRVGCERCERCDADGARKSMQVGHGVAYTCHGGLMDFAAPITAHGEIIGSFIGGQVLPEPPDENKFRRIAREINVDPEEYIRAVRKIPVIPKARIEAAAAFLYTMANVISKLAYNDFEDKKDMGNLKGNQAELKRRLKYATDIVASNTNSMKKLSEKFTELKQTSADSLAEVNSTKDTIKVIEDVASNTRILGFNASIEASLAKESGKGFGVIAQEVRSLADTSKMSADKIDEAMNTIREYTKKINDNVQSTEEIVDGSLRNMEEFNDVISDIEKILS